MRFNTVWVSIGLTQTLSKKDIIIYLQSFKMERHNGEVVGEII